MPGWTSSDEMRRRFEKYRPGGWWRRDLLLAVLGETYPRWLNNREVAEICRAIRPDWNWLPRGELHAAKSLGRLQGLGLVDRIGERGRLIGRVKGNDWKRGWLVSPGYRYRIVRREDSLI
jgi:hypothetical protein